MKEKFVVNLESERLKLRNYNESDDKFLINLWTNSKVTYYMGGPRSVEKMNEAVAEYLMNPYSEEYDLWILTLKETKEAIGHCGLLKKEIDGKEEVEVIYVIDKPFWKNGYASEVCSMLLQYARDERNLDRIVALINPSNKGSQKVAIKSGMNFEKKLLRENKEMHLYVY
jgi:ribosomal-protein-alanine N-acetyltransferase